VSDLMLGLRTFGRGGVSMGSLPDPGGCCRSIVASPRGRAATLLLRERRPQER